jgi:hypothetical protein
MYMRKEKGNENQDELKSWLPEKVVRWLWIEKIRDLGSAKFERKENGNENQDEH